MESYSILDELGEGITGYVVSAKQMNHSSTNIVALKIIENEFPSGVHLVAIREIQALKSIDSSFVIKLLDVFFWHNTTVLVLPLAIMDLKLFIMEFSFPPSPVFTQIILGLKACHDTLYIHGDLKPENILVFKENGYYIFKIADFGLSQQILLPKTMSYNVVTLWYRAPEILKGESYDYIADIWSLGCIMYELWTRDEPLFRGDDVDHQFALVNGFLESTINIDKILTHDDQTLLKCLTRKENRLDCGKLLDFFQKLGAPLHKEHNEDDEKNENCENY